MTHQQRYQQAKNQQFPNFTAVTQHDPSTFTQHIADKYHCTFKNCSKLYVHRRQAEDHYFAHHLNEPQYYCCACAKTFSFREALQAHNKLTHGGDTSQSLTANSNQSSPRNTPSRDGNNVNGNGNNIHQQIKRFTPILPKPSNNLYSNGSSSPSLSNNNRPRVSHGRVINTSSLPPPPALTPARNILQTQQSLPSLRPSPYARVVMNGNSSQHQVSNPVPSAGHATVVSSPSSSISPNSSGLRLIHKLPEGARQQQQESESITRHPLSCKYSCGLFLSQNLLNQHYNVNHEDEAEPCNEDKIIDGVKEDNDLEMEDEDQEVEEEEVEEANEIETFHFEGEEWIEEEVDGIKTELTECPFE